uniref:Transmembrane protein 116 n=1 Tax=Homo sapiens TaxID=9606 RepID=F8VWU6_HUMAN
MTFPLDASILEDSWDLFSLPGFFFLKLLASSDRLTSASQSVGITGSSCNTVDTICHGYSECYRFKFTYCLCCIP